MTTAEGRAALLNAISPSLRGMIRQQYGPDSCIASTRIGLDLLERLHVEAEAARVDVMLFSPAFAQRVMAEGRLPSSAAERERWVAETGGHSVGLGVDTPGKPGLHLGIVVEKRVLWDLSIDQASRPQHDLVIPGPLVMPIDAAFLAGKPRELSVSNGTRLVYRKLKMTHDWKERSPNWRKDGRDAPIRRRIVEAMLEAFGSG